MPAGAQGHAQKFCKRAVEEISWPRSGPHCKFLVPHVVYLEPHFGQHGPKTLPRNLATGPHWEFSVQGQGPLAKFEFLDWSNLNLAFGSRGPGPFPEILPRGSGWKFLAQVRASLQFFESLLSSVWTPLLAAWVQGWHLLCKGVTPNLRKLP